MKKKLSFILAAVMAASCFPVCALTGSEEKESEKAEIRGDIDDDGELSEADLSNYISCIISKPEKIETRQWYDYNGDWKINVRDVIKLKNVLDGTDFFWTEENMPVMDGSTSAIPLEAGFKSRMLGKNYVKSSNYVTHHKTHEAFDMLLSGETDMIFTVPISEEQKQKAADAGVHLNFTPVAKEAFVFIVNKNNPVNSLTQDQIRDIYSGVITNWKEVGGNDAPIVPFQRNKDSGSQNLVVQFMGDRELIDLKKTNQSPVTSMGSLMDYVTLYDNSAQAIGYSVYSYAAQMYENSSDVKFIAVDGVKPSKSTLADGSYPLISSTYVMYTDSAPESVHRFLDWAVSEEGQMCVLETGYLPVEDMEIPDWLVPYTKKGTGKPRDKDYKPDYFRSAFSGSIECDTLVDFLKDKVVEEKINDKLKTFINSAEVKEFSSNSMHISYVAVNGYISFNLWHSRGTGRDYAERTYFLNFDMRNGSQIKEFSDLFYKGETFINYVNDAVKDEIIDSYYNECYYDVVKSEFTGLTGDIEEFSIETVKIPENNPYLFCNPHMKFITTSCSTNSHWADNAYRYYLPDLMITGEFFDMREILDQSKLNIDLDSINKAFRGDLFFKRITDEKGKKSSVLDGSAFLTAEETAAIRENLEKAKKQLESEGITADIGAIREPDRSFQDTTMNIFCYQESERVKVCHMFDRSGNPLRFSDIFGKEFADLDDSVHRIKSVSLNAGEVCVETTDLDEDSMNITRIVKFDKSRVDNKYFCPGEEKASRRTQESEIKTVSWWGNKDLPVYSDSYVLDYGQEKIILKLKQGTKVTVKSTAYSHDTEWAECWDDKNDDYYGWIRKNYLN
ncbi:MAG: substrate-binding domain-containing protein [Oscillospiraceae bacterium]|nr:substrate-binding domain-containing protein [Oscillospiraceae bacterium]